MGLVDYYQRIEEIEAKNPPLLKNVHGSNRIEVETMVVKVDLAIIVGLLTEIRDLIKVDRGIV